MKLKTLITKAVTGLKQEGFTSSTIRINYCRHWKRILNYAGSDSILNRALIEEFLSQSGERDHLSLERECLNYREPYSCYAITFAFSGS